MLDKVVLFEEHDVLIQLNTRACASANLIKYVRQLILALRGVCQPSINSSLCSLDVMSNPGCRSFVEIAWAVRGKCQPTVSLWMATGLQNYRNFLESSTETPTWNQSFLPRRVLKRVEWTFSQIVRSALQNKYIYFFTGCYYIIREIKGNSKIIDQSFSFCRFKSNCRNSYTNKQLPR